MHQIVLTYLLRRQGNHSAHGIICDMESPVRSKVKFVIACSLAFLSIAQTPRPNFESASIKRNLSPQPGGTSMTLAGPGGSLRVTKATLHQLLLRIHDIRDDQLVGGANWVRTEAYDITAKADGPTTRDQARLMLRALLEDRFGVIVEREQREQDGYVLGLSRSDWRPGPDMHRALDNCAESRAEPTPGTPFSVPLPPLPSSGVMPSFGAVCSTATGLAKQLERTLKTTVVDRTGLAGTWNYVVAHGPLQPSTSVDGRTGDNRPDLFTALEEQLHLRLERRRVQTNVYLLIAAQRPTPDQ